MYNSIMVDFSKFLTRKDYYPTIAKLRTYRVDEEGNIVEIASEPKFELNDSLTADELREYGKLIKRALKELELMTKRADESKAAYFGALERFETLNGTNLDNWLRENEDLGFIKQQFELKREKYLRNENNHIEFFSFLSKRLSKKKLDKAEFKRK